MQNRIVCMTKDKLTLSINQTINFKGRMQKLIRLGIECLWFVNPYIQGQMIDVPPILLNCKFVSLWVSHYISSYTFNLWNYQVHTCIIIKIGMCKVNKILMWHASSLFQIEMCPKGKETLETGRLFGISAIIRSNFEWPWDTCNHNKKLVLWLNIYNLSSIETNQIWGLSCYRLQEIQCLDKGRICFCLILHDYIYWYLLPYK